MGPAMNPSFESDPRIMLESNFYYPQEDILFDYCKATGAQWNVVRPSYIIGAVRDGALNHMIGFSIYAAVQAHLKLPLAFPGDYAAWVRYIPPLCHVVLPRRLRGESWHLSSHHPSIRLT